MSAPLNRQLIQQAVDQGGGIVRLAPNWIPRKFCIPGRRLRLHPADLYALGGQRGGIDERWFASTTQADNGPGTEENEGLSFIYVDAAHRVLLRDAMDDMGADFLGQEVLDEIGGWVMFSKFFDNMNALPLHLHQSDEKAADVGQKGKPEAYFFPAQYNFALNTFPYTFFGLEPGTTVEQVIDCLKRWDAGDNGILALSKAYQLQVDTGWYVAPGVLHAPGTYCTYEPQRASDVFSIWQSLVDYPFDRRDYLVKNVPPEKHTDYDYLISLLDWDTNVDPHFKEHYFLEPRPAHDLQQMRGEGYDEKWITYGAEWFSAKHLTIEPGRTVTIKDPVAYGVICIQGYGRFGRHAISAPTMIRYGQMTEDEFFVTIGAAQDGVKIANLSSTEPLVILKHFNAGNPDMPQR